MKKEKNNLETDCFEKLKRDLIDYFKNPEGITPYVQTGLNFHREIDEKIVFSFCNDFQIDLRKGDENNELILSGIQSYYRIDEEIGDLLLEIIINFVHFSLERLPQFTLKIKNFEIDFDGFVYCSIIKEQTNYFEKYGFTIFSGTENSSEVIMKLDYTLTGLNQLLYIHDEQD